MKTVMMGLALGLVTTSVLTVTGCGGSSSSGSEAVAYNGKFIDDAVEGVYFECGDVTGTTAADGGFGTCPANSTVTFSIGNLVLGSSAATGDGIFFVTDIVEGASRTDTDNTDVLKIAALIQSLDSDGNATNGITIPDTAAEEINLIVTSEDTSIDSMTGDDVADMTVLVVDELVDDNPEMEVVTEEEAEAHLEDSAENIEDGTIEPVEPVTGATGSTGG